MVSLPYIRKGQREERAPTETDTIHVAHHAEGEAPRATVTGADMDYEGSIAIDRDLLDESGILPHEQVDVLNINTGGRFSTYAIEAPRGTRAIAVNGAAARLVQIGDRVIIVAYCQIPAEEARNYRPSVVVLGEGNAVERAV
jgi:aspartate 1-decarboxylase